MINASELAKNLHPLERKILPYLKKHNSLKELINASKLKEVEVVRALQWLQNKKVLEIKTLETELAILDLNGQTYKEEGLPERKFIKALSKGVKTIKELQEETKLTRDELNSCIGLLKKNNLITIKKEKELLIFLTSEGEHYSLNKHFPEEHLLKKDYPLELSKLNEEEKQALFNLKKRGIIKIKTRKTKNTVLTSLGEQLLKTKITINIIDRLTPEIIRKQSWKNKKFRKYDVKINVPKINGGKLQHYRKFLDETREKFMSLGFEEMTGPLVESDFWDMDALYMPQDHSARDIHEAYYVEGEASIDETVLERVKKAHEKGWGYKFSIEKTKRQLLRTQGTACSARKLASKELKIPGKYFGITRCFRYDVIDSTHLPDFNQVEGIVVEEGLTLKHLFGLLKLFAKEFAGTDEVRLVPGYFPFTEPSVELIAKHPALGWVELGGAGIFRPEVTKPLLGKKMNVIAWGLGIDRLGMFRLGLKDIRSLFSQDLQELRESKIR